VFLLPNHACFRISSRPPDVFDLPVFIDWRKSTKAARHRWAVPVKWVRLALEQFDLGRFSRARDPHRQIFRQNRELSSAPIYARRRNAKHASRGELHPGRLEQLPERPARRAKSRERK